MTAPTTKLRDSIDPKLHLILGFAALLIAASLLMSGWLFISRFDQTNHNRAANAKVWHAVVCQIEKSTLAQPKITTAQKNEVVKFYNGLLVNDVHTTPCTVTTGGKK